MSLAVKEMFDGIAPTYDALNRVLSLGTDQRWRRRAVAALGDVRGRRVLDICAGTLDLSVLAAAAGAEVVASDFAAGMLLRGRHKLAAPLVRADAMRLPFRDGAFGGALCGFGLRNLDQPAVGIREARRVLTPGGRLVILDFFRPRRAITRAVQALYNRRILPFIGGVVSGAPDAYRYLAASIDRFATREEVEALARASGFDRVTGVDLTAGIAALVICEVRT
ncbi:MAG TPA: ubiquinone/menaquinone biosynthesis methyltransferase [Kofleriaceae bacterium]|nr:ubiquinone/menaquinone biosynthesis methyltransferase [Kofleriaceae bacterium]